MLKLYQVQSKASSFAATKTEVSRRLWWRASCSLKFNLGIVARHNWIKSSSIVRRITTPGKLMCFNKRVEFLVESQGFLRANSIKVSTVTVLYIVADKSRLPKDSDQNQSISMQDVVVRCSRPEF